MVNLCKKDGRRAQIQAQGVNCFIKSTQVGAGIKPVSSQSGSQVHLPLRHANATYSDYLPIFYFTGVMPKKNYPETFSCEASANMNAILKSKVRNLIRGDTLSGESFQLYYHYEKGKTINLQKN
jgi:hypothetical protein